MGCKSGGGAHLEDPLCPMLSKHLVVNEHAAHLSLPRLSEQASKFLERVCLHGKSHLCK